MRAWRRSIGWIALALVALLPALSLGGLVAAEGIGTLLAAGPGAWAACVAAAALPLPILLAAGAWAGQRREWAAWRDALLHQQQAADRRQAALDQLCAEAREERALLQEQIRLTLAGLRQAEETGALAQSLLTATRQQQRVAEWDVAVRELTSICAAMWRLVHGWRTRPGPEAEAAIELPLPAQAELPLAVLRLLPASATEAARFDVDERFVRQAARYRAVYAAARDRLPADGPLGRAWVDDSVLGRLAARLALLPRPDHGRTVPAETLAVELVAVESGAAQRPATRGGTAASSRVRANASATQA